MRGEQLEILVWATWSVPSSLQGAIAWLCYSESWLHTFLVTLIFKPQDFQTHICSLGGSKNQDFTAVISFFCQLKESNFELGQNHPNEETYWYK